MYQRPHVESSVDICRSASRPWGVRIRVSTAAFRTRSSEQSRCQGNRGIHRAGRTPASSLGLPRTVTSEGQPVGRLPQKPVGGLLSSRLSGAEGEGGDVIHPQHLSHLGNLNSSRAGAGLTLFATTGSRPCPGPGHPGRPAGQPSSPLPYCHGRGSVFVFTFVAASVLRLETPYPRGSNLLRQTRSPGPRPQLSPSLLLPPSASPGSCL